MKFATIFAITATSVLALDDIVVPDKIAADTDVEITIKNDLGKSDSFDEGFAYYRLYLTVSPPGWGYNPVCWLVNQTTTDTTSVTVRIPASVGPNGDNYTISSWQFNTDPNAESSSSGFGYSDDFELTGASGVFSEYEMDPSGPWSLGNEDRIPCSAYDCVRQCKQQYFPDDAPGSDDPTEEQLCAYKKSYLCSAQCEGVEYDVWDSTWDDLDGDGKADFTCDVGTLAPTSTPTGTNAPLRPTGSATTSAGTATTSGPVETGDAGGAAGIVGVSSGVLVGGLVMGLAAGLRI